MTRNITLAVDEAVLEQAKVLAARQGTSVNGLVRNYLGSLVAKEQQIDDAREALLKLVDEKNGDLGKRGWEREGLYDR
jgi:hypothetical protein